MNNVNNSRVANAAHQVFVVKALEAVYEIGYNRHSGFRAVKENSRLTQCYQLNNLDCYHLNNLGCTSVPDATYQASRPSFHWFREEICKGLLPNMGLNGMMVILVI